MMQRIATAQAWTFLNVAQYSSGSSRCCCFFATPLSLKVSNRRIWLQCFLRRRSTVTSSVVGGIKEEEESDITGIKEVIPKSDYVFTPWNRPGIVETLLKRRDENRNNKSRFRQHVNPLAPHYQQPTQSLSDNWPRDVFENCARPLHLDIGCGKGGFLLDWVTTKQQELNFNYLGLEIRPLVAEFAKQRLIAAQKNNTISKKCLDFVGCNANVDLHRLMRLYHDAAAAASSNDSISEKQQDRKKLWLLQRVTIQFPDPHFKARHAKRRVVTESLVQTLAQYMPEGGMVLLQSDVERVVEDMRWVFGQFPDHFQDSLPFQQYCPQNPWGVPTEREKSVLERGLPVYRTLLYRTNTTISPI